MEKKRILVAVLNWGLGHATRSIPLIRDLEKAGFAPVLASDGEALLLLQKEFPELQWVELPSYNISYPKNGWFFKFHFFLKSPRILRSIYAEKQAVKKIIREQNIGGIISDNRFGVRSGRIPSVYITHQIKVLSGKTSFFSSKIHQLIICRFNECWIPDAAEERNLSGEMSSQISLPIPVKYLGIRSRFEKQQLPQKYDVMVLLSGPEPQRSLLEEKLLKELKNFTGNVLFIRGKIDIGPSLEKKGSVKIYNYLTGKDLEKALNRSKIIITRSGYSTLLDLAVLGKKAFLIPTPGQFEQEYLAKRMQRLNIAPYCSQEEFSFNKLKQVSSCTGFFGFPEIEEQPEIFDIFRNEV